MRVFTHSVGEIPTQAHAGDAGYDLVAVSEPKIVGLESLHQEGFFFKIDYIEYDTGVRLSPDRKVFSMVLPRSSISKTNLVLANSVGLIDTGYRGLIKLRFKYVAQPWDLIVSPDGEVMITIDEDKIYKCGDKIGQLVFFSHVDVSLERVTDEDFLDSSTRGDGGFGSTGR